MYHFLRQNPLLKPVFFFLLGILCAYENWMVELGITCLVSILLHWLFRKYISTRLHLLWPLCFTVFGFAHAYYHRVSPPQEDEEAYYYSFQLEKIKSGVYSQITAEFEGPHRKAPAKAILFIKGKIELSPNTRYSTSVKLSYPSHAANPECFDYNEYLALQEIYLTGFIDSSELFPIKSSPSFSFKAEAQKWQKQGSEILDQYLDDSKNASIAKALILGYAADLDPEIREAYSVTGTMHVLAVSGMHVGILFLLIQLICKPIPKAWLRLFLGLSGLWTYAFITGLSPSVLRAVTMFSMLGIGKELGRQSSVYNALAFSAMILLLLDPASLFHIGFQLSFLSVLGIVIFTPIIEKAIPCKFGLLKKIRTLFAVSLAAQISTGILSLYYFHQFPTWFFISNLLVVPLAAPIMISGIALLLFSALAPIAHILAWLCDFLLSLSSGIAEYISAWPMASLGPFYPSLLTCILLYACLYWVFAFFKEKNKVYLLLVISALILFQVDRIWTENNSHEKKKVMVFSVKGKSCLLIQQGKHIELFGDSLSDQEYKRQLEPYIQLSGLKLKTGDLKHSSLIHIDKTQFLFLQNKESVKFPPMNDSLLVIVSKHQKIPRKEMLPSSLFCKIVLDSSCDYPTRKYWTQFAEEHSIPLHDVRLQGAFIYEIHGKTG